MNFFEKLFPFRSFIQINDNSITAYWVLITILIFAYYTLQIIRAIKKLKKNVGSVMEGQTEMNFEKNQLLQPVWQEYSSTFVTIAEKRKTDEQAYNYFNERNLLSNNTNLKVINAIPSILVGLGILGTFVGLTFGISDFKTSSSEEIQDSISSLLAGMGTAFVTSIWGMLLSLIFTYIEKVKVHSLHDALHKLCFQLDKMFLITKEDERQLELLKQREVLDSYFVTKDENDNILKPANIFRDIYYESRKQSQALQSFSTDLAIKIEAGFSQILEQQNNLNTIPLLENLQHEINQLGSKLQDPASEMTQNVVKDLEQALARMIDELKTSISGSTKSEMESLAMMLSEAGSSLQTFPIMMKETSEGIQLLVNKLGDEMNDKIGGIQKGQGELIQKQRDGLQITEKLLLSFSNNINALHEFTFEFRGAAESFNTSYFSLNEVTKRFDEASRIIQKTSEKMGENQLATQAQMTTFLLEAKKTIEQMQASFEKAKLLTTEYGERFNTIELGLKSIFGQIQEGLMEYQQVVGASLESYLGKYSEALTTTSKALASASESQEQLVTDLIDELGKLNGRIHV